MPPGLLSLSSPALPIGPCGEACRPVIFITNNPLDSIPAVSHSENPTKRCRTMKEVIICRQPGWKGMEIGSRAAFIPHLLHACIVLEALVHLSV